MGRLGGHTSQAAHFILSEVLGPTWVNVPLYLNVTANQEISRETNIHHCIR